MIGVKQKIKRGFLIVFMGYCTLVQSQGKDIKIAFVADVHFADVYPNLEGIPENILPVLENGEKVLIRSMAAQLHSTRLFNENYFAFKAALDDAVKRGIKLIVLPGDFSDDGQPLHLKGLNKLMSSYVQNQGVSFFMINGNHDPTRPFGKDGGKNDFLGNNGMAQPIMSQNGMYRSDLKKESPTLVLEDIKEWGYEGIVEELKMHGFFPNEKYVYWETPFSRYNYENYDFESAIAASSLDKRTYNLDSIARMLPDVSYLVEPVKGIWLLALDANVYVPKPDGTGFNGAGIGYNEVLLHKKYLIDWTEKLVKEAKRLGKTLIAFSHYPMIDFNDGATAEMKALFGENSFQAYRVPSEEVGRIFADLGLKVHVGGHMHLNDTGIMTTKKGNTLVNIQTPSLAAYPPGYKIMTIKENEGISIETIALDSVPNFTTFFDLYKMEHGFLESNFSEGLWDASILTSETYIEFANTHLKELVRLRFLPSDWPNGLKEQFVNISGWQLLIRAYSKNGNGDEPISLKLSENKILKLLKKNQLTKSDFESWSGQDLIFDFYRFRNADQLALKDVEQKRLRAYKFLFNALMENIENTSLIQLQQFVRIFQKQMNGDPAIDFNIAY
ncbi:metallophosphoesterase [Maribacter sp. X9]|uniref:metallophosphoesterase n=1 Tax=Maribacter sp. X9 TaxID=3402159 RepID=UPI003AF3D246